MKARIGITILALILSILLSGCWGEKMMAGFEQGNSSPLPKFTLHLIDESDSTIMVILDPDKLDITTNYKVRLSSIDSIESIWFSGYTNLGAPYLLFGIDDVDDNEYVFLTSDLLCGSYPVNESYSVSPVSVLCTINFSNNKIGAFGIRYFSSVRTKLCD